MSTFKGCPLIYLSARQGTPKLQVSILQGTVYILASEQRKKLHFVVLYDMLTVSLPVNGGGLSPISGGNFLPPDLAKGGLLMSTSEVLQLCLVIIGICSLFIQAKKK